MRKGTPAPIRGSQKLGVGARFIAPSALLLLLLAPMSAKPIAPTPPPFLAGGDLSFLAAEEKGGAVYLPFEALTAQVRDYSRDTVTAFRRARAMPDIVQVGNETTNGMLWPDGNVEEPDGWTKFGTLFKAGAEGIREGAKPGRVPAIMLHVANSGSPGLMHWFFENLNAKKQNIDFDVVGLSYYPDGKDTLDGLKTSLTSLASLADTFKKPIVVIETGFPRSGTASENQPMLQKYGRTPDGQKHYLTNLLAVVKATPGGLGHGVVYWEPDWIGVPGLPHFGDANALFDDQFNALPGLGATRP